MKKALNIIKSILVWLLVAAAVGMMIFTVFSVVTLDRNERNVFGYKFFIVRSDSMSATDFSAGDIVFVKEVDPSTLQVGDIVSYISQGSDNFGDTVTHKIRSITTTESGEPGFVTYGTTTNTDDTTIVTYPYVLGKYVGRLPKVGTFFSFLKTTPGYIVCILVPFLLLIGYNGLNCIKLFRQYKQEQLDVLKEEREKIEAERRRSEEMIEQLKALQEQLAASGQNIEKAQAAESEPNKTDDAGENADK